MQGGCGRVIAPNPNSEDHDAETENPQGIEETIQSHRQWQGEMPEPVSWTPAEP
jgi:hypothetical protein